MSKILKEDKGSALVYVILVMVVLFIFGTSALSMSLANTKFSIRDEQSLNAYYIAKAGIDAVSKNFLENPASIKSKIDNLAGVTGTYGNGSYEVKISSVSSGIKLKSTGTINGTSISETISLGMNEVTSAAGLFDNVIYSDGTGTLDLDKMSNDTIKGELTARGKINKPYKDRTDYAYDTNEYSPVDYEDFTIPILSAGAIVSNKISASGSFGDVYVAKGQTLILDASAGDLTLVFKSLICDGAIEIIPNATNVKSVILYVEDSVYIGKNNNNSDPYALVNATTSSSNLALFLKGDSNTATYDFQVKGGTFNGYIYAPDAQIHMHNKVDFNGAIIAGEYTNQAGSDKVYVYYNAPDPDLDFSGIISGGYVILNYSGE